jgi:hypothetical protein
VVIKSKWFWVGWMVGCGLMNLALEKRERLTMGDKGRGEKM